MSNWLYPETVQFWGFSKGRFQAFGTMRIVIVPVRFGKEEVFKRHRSKGSDMLCFVVLGHQDP